MRPIDFASGTYIDFAIEIMIKVLNLKLVTILEYQNTVIFS